MGLFRKKEVRVRGSLRTPHRKCSPRSITGSSSSELTDRRWTTRPKLQVIMVMTAEGKAEINRFGVLHERPHWLEVRDTADFLPLG